MAVPNATSQTDDGWREPKSVRTRARILDAAAKVFRRQGYAARLSDIADEAGLQAASFYYYFDGRESLVEEVLNIGLERAWDHVRSTLDELPESATPLDRLLAAVRAHAEAILETSDYSAANSRIFAMASPQVHDRHYALQRRYGEYLHRLYQSAAASGALRPGLDLDVVRMLIIGATNWTAEWYRPDSGREPGDVVEELVALVRAGLAK